MFDKFLVALALVAGLLFSKAEAAPEIPKDIQVITVYSIGHLDFVEYIQTTIPGYLCTLVQNSNTGALALECMPLSKEKGD